MINKNFTSKVGQAPLLFNWINHYSPYRQLANETDQRTFKTMFWVVKSDS